MTDLFKLSPFEEFELWLNGLTAHYKSAGIPLGEKKTVDLNRDFREDVRTALQVVQDLISRSYQIVEAEVLEIRETDPSFLLNPDQDLKKQIRHYQRHARRIDEFLGFLDFTEHYKTLALSLIRLPHVSRREFRAFGFVLIQETGRLKKSEAHIYLKKRFYDWKFQHLIQRDIVSAVEMEGVREQLERVFLEFFHILSVIKYIQREMRRSFKFRKFVILFVDCHLSFKKFLRLLDDTYRYVDNYQPEIAGWIHSTMSALRLEMRKVFGRELGNLESLKKIDEIYAHMENACGLLQHAFQDSFINLIHLLNPRFNEFEIFEDLPQRYQESVILLNDLRRLHQMVKDVAGTTPDHAEWAEASETLQLFRDTSMKFLMFKDWQTCEQFIDELQYAQAPDRSFLLHRFEIYLSTLIGEVQKRSVFDKFDPSMFRLTTTADT